MQPFLKLWIWISAFATLVGWALSALGELNRVGYAVAFAAFAVFIFLRRQELGFVRENLFSTGRKFLRRFRRPPETQLGIGGNILPPVKHGRP